jgi:hypothetical protein
MTAAAFENKIMDLSAIAYATYTDYQYHAMYLDSSGLLHLCATDNMVSCGSLQDKPLVGTNGSYCALGISKVMLGDTVAFMDPLKVNSSGHYVPATSSDTNVVGFAMQAGVSGDVKAAFLIPKSAPRGSLRKATIDITAAEIAAGTITNPMVDHSVLVTAGEIASGDHLIFQGAVLQMYGGTANYDKAANWIVKNTTGTTLSTTVADFHEQTAGITKTIKAISTDILSVAGDDILMTMSATGKTSTGDRLMRITCFYSVFTPHV